MIFSGFECFLNGIRIYLPQTPLVTQEEQKELNINHARR